MIELDGGEDDLNSLRNGSKEFMEVQMSQHNLMSFNQLAEWTEFDSSNDEDLINDYFDCLIECEDDQSSCKRICKDMLV